MTNTFEPTYKTTALGKHMIIEQKHHQTYKAKGHIYVCVWGVVPRLGYILFQ